MSETPPTRYSKSCDQCAFRKIKCNRELPCKRCSQAELSCSYIKPAKRRGPKGKRIQALQQILQTEHSGLQLVPSGGQSQLPPVVKDDSPVILDVFQQELPPTEADLLACDEILISQCLPPEHVNLSTEMSISIHATNPSSLLTTYGPAQPLVQAYMTRMAKFYPLLESINFPFRLQANEYKYNPQFKALCLAIAAHTLVEPGLHRERALVFQASIPSRHELQELSKSYITESIQSRANNLYFLEQPTFDTMLISFYIFASFENMGMRNAAWLNLREASSFAQIMAAFSGKLSDPERHRLALVCRMLMITERGFLIQRSQLGVFKGELTSWTQPLREIDKELQTMGVHKLWRLFDSVQADTLSCWNNSCNNAQGGCNRMTSLKAISLHYEIRMSFDFETRTQGISDQQLPDIAITQLWLHLRLWNICYSHGLLNELDYDESNEMGLLFSLELARRAIGYTRMFSLESMEIHGSGFAGKLHDFAMTICRVASANPTIVHILRPVVNQYVAVLSSLFNGEHEYLVPVMLAVSNI
ncbi:uncharacterized protein V1518DRAFT_379940 [Limtongia smithiae]|uniref:uncharacterized protein n=1 Tax=Limtongia smithiae TaxID=1125753 RepID=UPI0034CDC835